MTIDHDALARRIAERLSINGFVSPRTMTECIYEVLREALPTSEETARLHAMVLVYEPTLTNSRWQDAYFEDARGMQLSRDKLIEKLKQGVRDGEWVAWRLVRIEQELMGND